MRTIQKFKKTYILAHGSWTLRIHLSVDIHKISLQRGYHLYLSTQGLCVIAQWLISDLIPKKYEKFEFSKTFATMFLSDQS